MLYEQQEFLSHHSGGWTSELKVLADSVSSEDLRPGSQTASLAVSSYVGGTRALTGVSFLRELIPSRGTPPS